MTIDTEYLNQYLEQDSQRYFAKKEFFNKNIPIIERCFLEMANKYLQDKNSDNKKIKSKEGFDAFYRQFHKVLTLLPLSENEEVKSKLKEIGFVDSVLYWMTSPTPITSEIERLMKVKGLTIFPFAFFTAFDFHIQVKFKNEMFESFGYSELKDGKEINLLYKDFAKRIERIEYNRKKKQLPKTNHFEAEMLAIIEETEDIIGNSKETKKLLLNGAKGNTSHCISLLSLFICDGISKNKAYQEIYPLLLLLKLDRELLTEEEFYNTKDNYDCDFKAYQISRCKKILK